MAPRGAHPSEAKLLQRLLIRGSELGARLFRNNTGRWQLADGRWVTTGLCVGSSDLIGWMPVTVTAAMVGQQLAVFVAVETKAEAGRVRPEQQQFLSVAAQAGAIAIVARSEGDLETALMPRFEPTGTRS